MEEILLFSIKLKCYNGETSKKRVFTIVVNQVDNGCTKVRRYGAYVGARCSVPQGSAFGPWPLGQRAWRSGGEKMAGKDQHKSKGDNGPERSFGHAPLWALVLCFGATAVCFHEITKMNTCFIRSKDAVQRDLGAMQESVCTDHTKVAMFGHRFKDGCTAARQKVHEGIVQSSFRCWMESHRLYRIVSLENTYANVALVVIVLFGLMQIKDYYLRKSFSEHTVEMLRLQSEVGVRRRHMQADHERVRSKSERPRRTPEFHMALHGGKSSISRVR